MTQTFNPLHFEDLEPHRFEDLVRQIVYDFKEWSLLEPTGRLGSDDGYDARGFEIVKSEISVEPDDDAENEDEIEELNQQERLWQIQCKREKSISPSKIKKYLDEMIPERATVPYGVIFAAPTDFSKKTRDAFREALRNKGVKEFYLWGKADLEDVLYQPKNDHLLYAYFGISFHIQRRSQKTKLRGILAVKRKAIKHLGPVDHDSFKEILIRDIDDDRYPYAGGIRDFKQRPAWKKYYFVGHEHNGIQILIRRFFAYRDLEYSDEGEQTLKAWDFTEKASVKPQDPWHDDPKEQDDHYAVYSFWEKLVEQKRAFFEVVGLIKYENIVEIDPEGDLYAKCPHVYVRRSQPKGFCEPYFIHKLVSQNRLAREAYLPKDADKVRIKIFPDTFPDPRSNAEKLSGGENPTGLKQDKEANKEASYAAPGGQFYNQIVEELKNFASLLSAPGKELAA